MKLTISKIKTTSHWTLSDFIDRIPSVVQEADRRARKIVHKIAPNETFRTAGDWCMAYRRTAYELNLKLRQRKVAHGKSR